MMTGSVAPGVAQRFLIRGWGMGAVKGYRAIASRVDLRAERPPRTREREAGGAP